MEQENINTFYKNVDEISGSESFVDLRDRFKIVGPKTIEWKETVTKKVEDLVEYFASQYLL